MQPFHLAIPVDNLEEAYKFYTEVLGCATGRSSEKWIDYDFYGHQLVTHLDPSLQKVISNDVDGKQVPARHFGVVLEWQEWHNLAERLKEHEIDFIIEPYIRFKGEVGEQATMFFSDPSGNAIEMKSFKDPSQLFAK